MESIESEHGCLLQDKFVCYSLIKTFYCILPNNPRKHNFHDLCENTFYVFCNSNEPEHVHTTSQHEHWVKTAAPSRFSGKKLQSFIEEVDFKSYLNFYI